MRGYMSIQTHELSIHRLNNINRWWKWTCTWVIGVEFSLAGEGGGGERGWVYYLGGRETIVEDLAIS